MKRSDASSLSEASEIAVIGMIGRFPTARNLDVFWEKLRDGVELMTFFSDEELIASGIDASVLTLPNYVKAGTVLEEIDLFDAAFFGYNPREAEMMDPQQRLFLECAWEALESAGYRSDDYQGRVGVYAGANTNTYFLFSLFPRPDLIESASIFQTMIGNEYDHLTTRVSYKLNLKGPSIVVQTACSTSLVAVHLACQGLLTGECDIALAGGVSVRVPQKSGYFYQPGGGINSPDGHCRAFDSDAQGTVAGSGIGIVVLKRLEDALADADTIHAVIKGSAINNDGSFKVGYTAPSIEGQAEVIAEALAMAGADSETISYIEAHGTATPLGDPIEVAALTKVFRSRTDKTGFCAIGSVKTNMGHLGAAAGVAGLIKTVLALKHKQIPASLHYRQANPKIDFADSAIYVNTSLREWKSEGPRRAGVSSFGIGGTNAHVVVEEAPEQEEASASRRWQLLVLSAKTSTALEQATTNLKEYLREKEGVNLADAAYTLAVGRGRFSQRRAVVSEGIEDAVRILEGKEAGRVFTGVHEGGERQVVFMFPGLGDHYVSMGAGLYSSEAVFREQVDLCSELLKQHLGVDLRDVLYPGVAEAGEPTGQIDPAFAASDQRFDMRKMLHRDRRPADDGSHELNRTLFTQPAIFVIEYALARLWMHWGIRPRAMAGYSLGEYVAACLAGVLSLKDALLLVAKRAQMIQELPEGAMLAVPVPESEVQMLLGERLSVAAVNGPSLCVVSGPPDAVCALEAQLVEKGTVCRRLQTSHAFHSKMMLPIYDSFNDLIKTVKLSSPEIPFLSNLTGTWITAMEATSPDYWSRHMCEPVRFSNNIIEMLKESDSVLLEAGPGQTLGSMVMQHPDNDFEHVVLASLRYSYDSQPDAAFLLSTLGKLWAAGAQVNWPGFYDGQQRRHIPLPTYPFERRRYWIEPQIQPNAPKLHKPPSGKKADIAGWFYVPVWKQSIPSVRFQPGEQRQEKSNWLVCVDKCELGTRLVNRLESKGHNVITVIAGKEFARFDDDLYSINPAQLDDYRALLGELRSLDMFPQDILHLWTVTDDPSELRIDRSEMYQAVGFYSLLNLAQSIGNFTQPVRIWVVSNNLHNVTGEESICPDKTTVLGPCKVIGREYANIACRSVDVVLPDPGSQQQDRLIDQIMTELGLDLPDVLVAYRGDHRWVQTFDAVQLDTSSKAPERLREGGVYLITGGLGGIGFTLAEYLAQTVKGKLVLTGRSPFPARDEWEQWLSTHSEQDKVSATIRRIQALEEMGAEALVISADVADEEQMQNALAVAHQRFGQIHGLIHAAGIAGGGMIQLKTPEVAESVLESKVRGMLVLDALFKDENLDFLVLCSSMGAIMGGFGEVDYCAGNAFLDAYAHHNARRRGAYTVSINWDVWQEVGLAINTAVPAEFKRWREEIVKKGILRTEGMEVFERILCAEMPQVVVSTQDFQMLVDQHNAFSATAALKELEEANLSRTMHPRPLLGTAYVAPRNLLEQSMANMWQELLGIEQVGIHDSFFDLGGHSLLGTLIISRLRDIIHLEVPLQMLFEFPTVAKLSAALLDGKNGRAGREEITHMLAEMEELSDEEVDRLLAAEMLLNDEKV